MKIVEAACGQMVFGSNLKPGMVVDCDGYYCLVADKEGEFLVDISNGRCHSVIGTRWYYLVDGAFVENYKEGGVQDNNDNFDEDD